MRGRLASLAAAAALLVFPAAARRRRRALAGRRPGHRRPLRRPDRARPRRPGRRRQGRRARRAPPTPATCARRCARPTRPPTRRSPTACSDAAQAAATATRRRSPPPAAAVRAGLFRGAYAVTTEATARGDAATAKRWLLLREYRTATRFTRPGAQRDARARPARARQAHRRRPPSRPSRKDLLDAYQARLRELLARRPPRHRAATSPRAAPRPPRRPPATSRSSPRATPRTAARPPSSRRSAAFDALPEAGDGPRRGARRGRRARSRASPPRPFTPEEAARRAQQLLQFLALVPVEYGRGVKGDQRHARLRDHRRRSPSAPAPSARSRDLRDQLAKRDRGAHRRPPPRR